MMASFDWDLLSSYAGLLLLATISIYAGSFGSLPKPKRPGAGAGAAPDDDDDEEELPERLSTEDAWLFPVFGSVALFGLYIIVKYLGKDWINWILGWYFSVVGVGSIWKSCISLARYLLGTNRWKQFDRTTFTIKKGLNPSVTLSWRTPSLILFPIAIIPSAVYTLSSSKTKPALVTDILSLSFSHNALSLLKLDSFQTGTILLSGLFLYDIWWVFGTEVMVNVATNLDIPIKLLWPKSLTFSNTRGFTMLGLGDVVIPGTVIALALRYDYYRCTQASPPLRSFMKPYFYATLSAYILGLITTMSVMHYFGKAQPALLYLSPACILSFVVTAVVRGELWEMWSWSDAPEQDSSVDAKKEKSN